MVIKMDKSQEFVKSGRKLISEYDADAYYQEEEEKKTRIFERRPINKRNTSKTLIDILGKIYQIEW